MILPASATLIPCSVFPPDPSGIVWLKVDRKPIDTPLAVRAVDQDLQTIKMRVREIFDATVSTVFGLRPVHVTGFVMKDEGFAPHIGKARLQEMIPKSKSEIFVESGWERETTITSVRTCTLREFKKAVQLGKAQNAALSSDALTQQDALRCGYASLDDMKSKICQLFANQDRSPDADDSRLHIGTFALVGKETTTYFNPHIRPLAGFEQPLTSSQKIRLWENPGVVIQL